MEKKMTTPRWRLTVDSYLVIVLLVFADVMAFNQAATQSAIDANWQMVFWGLFVAGAAETLRRIFRRRIDAIATFVVSAAGFLGWYWDWSKAILAILTLLGAAIVGLEALRKFNGAAAELERLGAEPDSHSPQRTLGGVLFFQTFVMVGFAFTALLA